MKTEYNDKKETEQKPLPPKTILKKQNSQEDFKRKYFEYYDDVKISDRQDW